MKKIKQPQTSVVIPHKELSHEALMGVIEQFITRDGTDSGHIDISFDRKVEQIMHQLDSGKAVIVFDSKLESCNIVSKDDLEG